MPQIENSNSRMKQFVKIITFLLTLSICAERSTSNGISLNDRFVSCNFPNCTIYLHGGEYVVNRTLVVERWENFNLSASEQTIVRCSNDMNTTVIRSNGTKACYSGEHNVCRLLKT